MSVSTRMRANYGTQMYACPELIAELRQAMNEKNLPTIRT